MRLMRVTVLERQQDRLWADALSNLKKANLISKTRLVLVGHLFWMKKICKPLSDAELSSGICDLGEELAFRSGPL
ncbi:hypothetical protein KIN20_027950 [Parelaphostrongylus tenuis]|uniref:Uncharacterized protein n=1 Tax=Parelaphostrongylus tenuis TaxID=148309 RepID=A0AAD5R043_PARTN|nr:hypothetical protein KIN20_027950 [Parelaphostrongylus tenuis]